MNNSQESLICEGGCHCASVRLKVLIDRFRVEDCNCSICCLDRDLTAQFTIRTFDGQNWEDNVAQIRD